MPFKYRGNLSSKRTVTFRHELFVFIVIGDRSFLFIVGNQQGFIQRLSPTTRNHLECSIRRTVCVQSTFGDNYQHFPTLTNWRTLFAGLICRISCLILLSRASTVWTRASNVSPLASIVSVTSFLIVSATSFLICSISCSSLSLRYSIN